MRMRSSSLLITTLILISLFISAAAYADIQVVFPVKDKMKAVSDMHVVGISNAEGTVTISINGRLSQKNLIASKDKSGKDIYLLMAILKLDDGENNISITQGTDTKTFNITKVDTPTVIDDWTENLSEFHKSGDKTVCLNCHRFENIGDCINCHRDKFSGEWVHSPVRQGKCFTCHDKKNDFIPQEPIGGTCLDCHKAKKEALDKSKFQHEPTQDGYCTICHSPHKSNVKTHLRKPVNELCAQCHDLEDKENGVHAKSFMRAHPVDKVFADKINKTLDCADCHNPHFADNEKMVDAEGGAEHLCVKCHDPQDAADLMQALKDEQESSTEEAK